MFQIDEFLLSLEVVYDALVHTLHPNLNSDGAKDTASNVESVLGRMIAELRQTAEMGKAHFEKWADISAQLDGIEPAGRSTGSKRSITKDNNAFAGVQAQITYIQHRLNSAMAGKDFLTTLARPDTRAYNWFSKAIHANNVIISSYEASLPSLAVASAGEDFHDISNELRLKLNTYLKNRYGQIPSAVVKHLQLLSGGNTKRTAILDLEPNDLFPARVVFRGDVGETQTGTIVANEYPLLEKLHELGMPVPKPFLCESDPQILGGSFIIMDEVTGAVRAGEFFPELSGIGDVRNNGNVGPEFGAEVGRALARLHRLKELPGTISPELAPPISDIQTMIREFYQLWLSSPKPPMSLGTDLGFAWLLSHPLPADRPQCVVHGDVSATNLMVRNGHLAALLDWELVHLGDPAEDIGYARMLMFGGFIQWEEFQRAYIAEGGDAAAFDPHAVNFFGIWSHVRNSVYTAILRKYFLDGDRRDIGSAKIYWDFGPRLQDYLNRELSLVL